MIREETRRREDVIAIMNRFDETRGMLSRREGVVRGAASVKRVHCHCTFDCAVRNATKLVFAEGLLSDCIGDGLEE